jgi:hypothetical protein
MVINPVMIPTPLDAAEAIALKATRRCRSFARPSEVDTSKGSNRTTVADLAYHRNTFNRLSIQDITLYRASYGPGLDSRPLKVTSLAWSLAPNDRDVFIEIVGRR